VSGDGKRDLIVTNLSADTVSVLIGNGNGTFQAKVDYPTASKPRSVALADVNGDKRADLVVANGNAGTVSVLAGNGDGTFQSKVDYSIGLPYSVVIVDLNGDAKPDLAIASQAIDVSAFLGNVTVLLGNGNGTFQASVDYPAGMASRVLVAADVSGDGKPDLVVENSLARTVSVLIGNGDGTLQPKVAYPAGLSPRSIAVGDVTSDGGPDIVVADGESNRLIMLEATCLP